MQVEHFLERSAARLPDKTALVCGDRRLTYREIDEECDRLARVLGEHGVQRGDRVALYLDNSVEAVVSVFAVLKAGAAFMPVNPAVKPDKLAFLLNDARAVALVADRRRIDSLSGIPNDTPYLRRIVSAGGDAFPSADRSREVISFSEQPATAAPVTSGCIDIDIASLIYTSGSTGQPKGVVLTHLNIVSATTSITTYLEITEADILLNVLPLSFGYGLSQVLTAFNAGATVVLERSFAYPHAVLETLVREKATGFAIVPTLSAILLQMDLGQYDFSALRYVTNAAAALPTGHILQLRRLFPHVAIYSMYGLTECIRATYLPPDQIDVRPDSVGKGMPNEEVYIVDEQGNRLASGAGELVIRGSNVMKGYWERPEETDRALRPGPLPGERVLYSGDIFRMDEDGYLYFVGRKDDIVKTRGEKVSPREVENVLCELAGVAEAVVLGVPDPILGQAIKAVIRPTPGAVLTRGDVVSHCARRLEDFMVPKVVEFCASIPKNANGKIDKQELKARCEQPCSASLQASENAARSDAGAESALRATV